MGLVLRSADPALGLSVAVLSFSGCLFSWCLCIFLCIVLGDVQRIQNIMAHYISCSCSKEQLEV